MSERHPQHRQQAGEARRNLVLLSPEAKVLRGKGGYSPPTSQSKKHPGAPTNHAPGRDAAPQAPQGQSGGSLPDIRAGWEPEAAGAEPRAGTLTSRLMKMAVMSAGLSTSLRGVM